MDILIYIPTYNAKNTLLELLQRFSNIEKRFSNLGIVIKALIFVNDGSIDGTSELLKGLTNEIPYVRLIDKKINEGPTQTLFDGMSEISKLITNPQKTIIIRMDADLEHQPEDLPKLIEPILSCKTKISVGYIPFDSRSGDAIRQFNVKIGLEESRHFLDLDIPQFCPGFSAVRGDLFAKMHPILINKSEEFKKKYGKEMLTIDFIVLVVAKKLGETPVVVKLSPIEDTYIKKQPAEKIEEYFDYHKKTIEFLENELKS